MEAQSEGSSRRKPLVFHKMEMLVRQMQSQESGVPVRCQKLFLTTIPSAFMGYDLVEWLMENLPMEDSAEALHLSTLLCQHGYFFPVGDARTLQVKDDSSLYRFQTPYYWPSQNHSPDSTDYAIYLHKKINKNRQKGSLDEYELECYSQLKKSLSTKWDFISMQADEQLKMAKDRKKGDKIVSESQERAYWRVYRPPPGFTNTLELPLVPQPSRAPGTRTADISSLLKQVKMLRKCVSRSRVRVSQVVDALVANYETYLEFDPLLSSVLPSNPWLTDDPTFMELNQKLVECPTEQRVRRWAINVHEIVSDPTGLAEFTKYMKKEFCHENIRFWLAVYQLKKAPLKEVKDLVQSIYNEFLRPGAPCEINIDGKTMEITQERIKNPDRTSFDCAAEHIFELLLKKDCYPRFLRSEQYKTLLLTATNPTSKKRFFPFGAAAKKKISTISPPSAGQLATAGATIRPDEVIAAAGGARGTSHRLEDQPYRGDLCEKASSVFGQPMMLQRDAEDAGIFLGDTGASASVPSCSLSSRSNPTVASSHGDVHGVGRQVSITKEAPDGASVEQINQLKSSNSAPGPIDAAALSQDQSRSTAATAIPKDAPAITSTTVPVSSSAKLVPGANAAPGGANSGTSISANKPALTATETISTTPVQKFSTTANQPPKTPIELCGSTSLVKPDDSKASTSGGALAKDFKEPFNKTPVSSQAVSKLGLSHCSPDPSSAVSSKVVGSASSLILGTNTQVTSVLSSGGIPSVSAPVCLSQPAIAGAKHTHTSSCTSPPKHMQSSDSKQFSVTTTKQALVTTCSTESTEDRSELTSKQTGKSITSEVKVPASVVGNSSCGITPPPLMFQDAGGASSTVTPTQQCKDSVKSTDTKSKSIAQSVASDVYGAGAATEGVVVEKSKRKTQIVTLTDNCAQTVETGDNPIYETADQQCEASVVAGRKSHGGRRREKRSSEHRRSQDPGQIRERRSQESGQSKERSSQESGQSKERRSQEPGQNRERRSMKKKQESVRPKNTNADPNEQSTSKHSSCETVGDKQQNVIKSVDASDCAKDYNSTHAVEQKASTLVPNVTTALDPCMDSLTSITSSGTKTVLPITSMATCGTKTSDSQTSTVSSALSSQSTKVDGSKLVQADRGETSAEATDRPSEPPSTTSEQAQIAVSETIIASTSGSAVSTFSPSHRDGVQTDVSFVKKYATLGYL